MKRIVIGFVIVIIVMIAFGLTMKSITDIQKYKDNLINIGDSYSTYVSKIEEYTALENKESEYAISALEYANSTGNYSMFLLRLLDESYEMEMFNKCLAKLSKTQIDNLRDAVKFCKENNINQLSNIVLP